MNQTVNFRFQRGSGCWKPFRTIRTTNLRFVCPIPPPPHLDATARNDHNFATKQRTKNLFLFFFWVLMLLYGRTDRRTDRQMDRQTRLDAHFRFIISRSVCPPIRSPCQRKEDEFSVRLVGSRVVRPSFFRFHIVATAFLHFVLLRAPQNKSFPPSHVFLDPSNDDRIKLRSTNTSVTASSQSKSPPPSPPLLSFLSPPSLNFSSLLPSWGTHPVCASCCASQSTVQKKRQRQCFVDHIPAERLHHQQWTWHE